MSYNHNLIKQAQEISQFLNKISEYNLIIKWKMKLNFHKSTITQIQFANFPFLEFNSDVFTEI